MIATCYDSFIISRRVIPWNPVPQFILGATYVPLYPTSRRIITNVASEPYEEVRVDADAAFRDIYMCIMPVCGAAQQFSSRPAHRHERFSAFCGIITALLNSLVLTDNLFCHSHALLGIFQYRSRDSPLWI